MKKEVTLGTFNTFEFYKCVCNIEAFNVLVVYLFGVSAISVCGSISRRPVTSPVFFDYQAVANNITATD